MRILVSGGAGFLGSHLVDLLLGAGHRVVVVDNFITGRPENLAHARTKRLVVVRADAARTAHDEYDRVYHLASPASPEDYWRAPIRTLLANAVGTRRLLDIAEGSGARFLLASTSEIYGDPLSHPQRESDWGNVDPIGPRSAYDEGKRFAEALTVAYVRERGVDARIARIFNTYGPRMRIGDGRMPAAFIVAALGGDPIRVYGDGSQTRSLCYVTDTARGLVLAMEKGRAEEAYNLGTQEELSVLAFARTVRRLARSRSTISFLPARDQDPRRRRPDTTKAARDLGWRPRIALTTGIRRTIEWYREQLRS